MSYMHVYKPAMEKKIHSHYQPLQSRAVQRLWILGVLNCQKTACPAGEKVGRGLQRKRRKRLKIYSCLLNCFFFFTFLGHREGTCMGKRSCPEWIARSSQGPMWAFVGLVTCSSALKVFNSPLLPEHFPCFTMFLSAAGLKLRPLSFSAQFPNNLSYHWNASHSSEFWKTQEVIQTFVQQQNLKTHSFL